MNQPLPAGGRKLGHRYERFDRPAGAPPGIRLFLAFSGGGTRAAALSYGVMEALRARKLLETIDVISSASGGSFTAAYFGLFRERLFADFRRRFLDEDVLCQLISAAISPVNLVRMLSPEFDRVDVAAEVHDRLFEGKRFSDFPAIRPFVVLNATNMTLGARLPFTQNQFDLLGSDLDPYPVARAVTASSAFPILLSPLTLKNYGAQKDEVFDGALSGLQSFDQDLEAYRRGLSDWSYRDATLRPYCHLLDGGLADNAGARHLVQLLQQQVLQELTSGADDRFVFVAVDAKGEGSADADRRRRAPGLGRVAIATGATAMDNYTDDSVIEIEQQLRAVEANLVRQWNEASQTRKWAEPHAPLWHLDGRAVTKSRNTIRLPVLVESPGGLTTKVVSAYVVLVSLFRIEAGDEQSQLRARLLRAPTTFTLPLDLVDDLVDQGAALLEAASAWREFVSDAKI